MPRDQPDWRFLRSFDQARHDLVRDGAAKSDDEAAAILSEESNEAQGYIEAQRWCGEIKAAYVAMIEPGVISIFLFNQIPKRSGIDPYIWVVVGDIPSAYIPCFEIPRPYDALSGYIYEMRRWSDAAIQGNSVEGLYPIGLEPTVELGRALAKKVGFIERNILPNLPH
ncbi:MAG: hypothetical protein ACJA0Y_000575 [Maricaulis maris]|jgi:hypothetical protein